MCQPNQGQVKTFYPSAYNEKTGFYHSPVPMHRRQMNPKLQAIYEHKPKNVPNGGFEIFLAPSERIKGGLRLLPGKSVPEMPAKVAATEPLHWNPGPEVALPRKSLCTVSPCKGKNKPPAEDEASRTCETEAKCITNMEHSFCGIDETAGYGYFMPTNPTMTESYRGAEDSSSLNNLHLPDENMRSDFNISPLSSDTGLEEKLGSLDLLSDPAYQDVRDISFYPTPIRRTRAQIFHP